MVFRGDLYNFGRNGALIESADTVKKDNMSAADVLTLLKNELDGSYGCDNVVSEKEAVEYFGLDSSKIDSIVYENNSINAINMDTALIIKVKDGYADEAEKVDKAWEKIFGTKPENIVKIPDAFELEEGMVL